MTEAIDVVTVADSGRIPIRNLWHMLLYASDLGAFTGRFDAAVEDSPTLVALVARLLADIVERRLRRGLPRGYEPRVDELPQVRGRIDVVRALVARAPERGRVICRYESYEVDTPRNRIIRATLVELSRGNVLRPQDDPSGTLRGRLRHIVHKMASIAPVRVTRELLHLQEVGRNDHEARLVLALCELAWWLRLPTEVSGPHALPAMDKQRMTLWAVYERFVARFYALHLRPRGWTISRQSSLKWPVDEATEGGRRHLPEMRVDLALWSPDEKLRVYLDTKFTDIITTSERGRKIFSSGHIYQLYAYLRSQEDSCEHQSEGILLYPAVKCRMDENVTLQGNKLRFVTIDLAQAWRLVEADLLEIVAPTDAKSEKSIQIRSGKT